MSAGKHVDITLNDAEALVLFDLLARLVEEQHARQLRALTEHDAEIWALNSVYLSLQRILSQPFSGDYRQAVDLARFEVSTACGGAWPS